MESTIIYIFLFAMIITVALVSVISRNRKIPTTGTVIPRHYPKIPAPKPSRIQSPFDGGGDDGGEDGDGFGAGRGGSCNGITVPFCGDSFSLLISDGFENIVDITVGLGGSGSLDGTEAFHGNAMLVQQRGADPKRDRLSERKGAGRGGEGQKQAESGDER